MPSNGFHVDAPPSAVVKFFTAWRLKLVKSAILPQYFFSPSIILLAPSPCAQSENTATLPRDTILYADVIDAVKNDRKPYIDAVAGRNAVEMILAIYQSAATGQPVKLPLTDVASTDFEGRFDK